MEDGNSRRDTFLGPRFQEGGSGSRLATSSLAPRGKDQLLRRQAFRRRSRTPMRQRNRSHFESSDSSEADRSVAGPVPVPVDQPVDRQVEGNDRPVGRSVEWCDRTCRSSSATGTNQRRIGPRPTGRPDGRGERPIDRPVELCDRTGWSSGAGDRTGPRQIAVIFMIVGRSATIVVDIVGGEGTGRRALVGERV